MIKKDTPLQNVLELSKNCKKCGHCCSYGSGYILEKELKRIAEFLQISEKELKEKHVDEVYRFGTFVFKPKLNYKSEKPYGNCVFLKNKQCSIHTIKPLHCRIGNCSPEFGEQANEWFMVNYLVDPYNANSIREWALRIETRPTIEGARPEDLVGAQKLKKIMNYEIIK
jgi:Fe-S-cluster containining protein